MTTLNEAREALYKRFNDLWVDGLGDPLTPFTFDNETFEPPETGSWVRVAVRHLFSSQETLGKPGNRKFRRPGSLIIQLFTATETGMESIDTLSEKVRSIFEGITLVPEAIHLGTTTIRESGTDGKWNQSTAETPFDYDETK